MMCSHDHSSIATDESACGRRLCDSNTRNPGAAIGRRPHTENRPQFSYGPSSPIENTKMSPGCHISSGLARAVSKDLP
jgi:hypothetical protein